MKKFKPHGGISRWAFRFAAILAFLLSGSTTIKADESLLKFEGVTPAPGSEITSFDFTLKFDLSAVIEANGEGDYGVGWAGYHNDKRPEKEQSVAIYKGNPEEGIVIGRVCTSGFTGKSTGFVTGPEVNISIEGMIPEPGETYTMLITNGFRVYVVGSSSMVQNTILDCSANPITYTFIGAAPSGEQLTISGSSITANQSIDELTDVTFNFSQQVSVNSNVSVEVLENDAVYASSTNAVLSDDKTSVTYHFDNVLLRLGHSYVISLPDGAVSSADDASGTNDRFNVPVTGAYVGHFEFKSSTPASGDTEIFTSIEAIFDMPEGFRIYKQPQYVLNLDASLYKGEISEENLVGKLDGVNNESMNGIVWANNYVLEPSTKYILYKPKGEFRARDNATDKLSDEWYNGEVLIELNTPSIADAGFPPIELGEPVIGKHDAADGKVLKNGDAVDYIDFIDIAPVDYFYKGKEGENSFHLYGYGVTHKGFLYDITSETPELLKEVSMSCVQRETTMFYYSVINVTLKSVFYEGHRYRLVIPKDEFTINYPIYYNYVLSPEYTIEFEGATPTEAELVSCTLQEGEERSSLCNIMWTFKGKFELNPEAEAVLTGGGINSKYLLTSTTNYLGNTNVVAHIYSSLTGEPLTVANELERTLTLPEGTLYYQTDPTITNKEISITFKMVPQKDEVPEPEFVNVSVNINGFHSTSFEAIKDRKLTLSLIPDGNWKVTALTRDGNDVFPFIEDNEGVYTTPALTADTKIEATVEYDGVVVNDIPSAVATIPDTAVEVYSEGGHIVVDGVDAGDVVAVYTTNGMLVAEQAVTEAYRAVRFTIANGQVYIVRINDKAVKIQH